MDKYFLVILMHFIFYFYTDNERSNKNKGNKNYDDKY